MADEYKFDDLEVVCFIYDTSEPEDVPRLIHPVAKSISLDRIIGGFEEKEESVLATEYLHLEEPITYIAPSAFQAEHAFYISAGSVEAEYLSFDDITVRLIEFSDRERSLGDEYFRDNDFRHALEHYQRASIASEEAIDYARIILCDVPEDYKIHLVDDIRYLGENWETLVEEVREKILDDL
jgi:hypothetical protein